MARTFALVAALMALAGCTLNPPPTHDSPQPSAPALSDTGGDPGEAPTYEFNPRDLTGYAPSSPAEQSVESQTAALETADELAALHLAAARAAGAASMEGSTLNAVAGQACVNVLSGASDIDVFYTNALIPYEGTADWGVAVVEVASAISTAGWYCPQLFDEFRFWGDHHVPATPAPGIAV